MLRRLSIEGIKFPRLYIAENNADVQLAKANGIPYIKWKLGQEELVRQLLRPTLEAMFPGIKWSRVLGKKKPVKSQVHMVEGRKVNVEWEAAEYDKDEMLEAQLKQADPAERGWDVEQDADGTYVRDVDIAESERDCPGGESYLGYDHMYTEQMLRIEDYVGDLSSSVNIDALQKLGLLPKFVGDIADNIKHNFSTSMRWTEGYTKKLGYPLGRFSSKAELPNLLIIDISWSIPDGIAATMLSLADTLRSQCNADLIITSARSGYYEAGSELPKPQTLRDYYGRSNEAEEFIAILKQYVAGREFGHVISFGDNDNPGAFFYGEQPLAHCMANTRIHEVHHYHTSYTNKTGYAKWVHECSPDVVTHIDTSWCNIIDRGYTM